MFHLSPRQWMAVGLLVGALGIGLRAIGPASLHSDLGDGFVGLMVGLGIGIEILALVKMRKAG